jgi:hypothetical protein
VFYKGFLNRQHLDIMIARPFVPFSGTAESSKAIESHVWLSRYPRALPYPELYSITDIKDLGFNIAFYEIIDSTHDKNIEVAPGKCQEADDYDRPWVSGELYGDSKRRHLRYSACTVSVIAVKLIFVLLICLILFRLPRGLTGAGDICAYGLIVAQQPLLFMSPVNFLHLTGLSSILHHQTSSAKT